MGFAANIVNVLPEGLQQFIRKRYYPGVLQKYTADHWPCTPAVHALVPEGGVVVDAGANVGYLSHLFAQWVGASGQVHSFEPVPWTHEILVNNVRKLNLDNVTVHAIALSDAAGSAVMQIPRYADGRENLYESHITTSENRDTDLRSVDVNLGALDDVLFASVERVDFIKIDVEGHELNVVRGAKEILTRDHPPLLIEVSGNLAEDDSAAGGLRQELEALGYAVHTIDDGRVTPWDGARRCVDYFFLPKILKELA